MKKYHTVIIGGGCLGSAAAVSLARHLTSLNKDPAAICLIEKNLLNSALSLKHSGIVRSANADLNAARLAKISTEMWLDLKNYWGVDCQVTSNGALWIAKKNQNETNAKWDQLAHDLKGLPVKFNKISHEEASKLCPDYVMLNEDEVFYFEPDACQIDPSVSRNAIHEAVIESNATLFENEEVMGFKKNKNGKITEVVLKNRVIQAENIINAAGAWSPRLFQGVGLNIPIGVEPVYVINWLHSLSPNAKQMPIIADYANRAYFRTWRDGDIHMHQPRKRGIGETSTLFADNPLEIIGADFINNPINQMQGLSNIRLYEDIAHKRFKDLQNTVFSSGYQSYFDITPDLKFILGPDSKIDNLYHCLGSGQAFKFAPVFGEMMKEFIFGNGPLSDIGSAFSIKRFDTAYMEAFWDNVSGKNYSLSQESSSL